MRLGLPALVLCNSAYSAFVASLTCCLARNPPRGSREVLFPLLRGPGQEFALWLPSEVPALFQCQVRHPPLQWLSDHPQPPEVLPGRLQLAACSLDARHLAELCCGRRLATFGARTARLLLKGSPSVREDPFYRCSHIDCVSRVAKAWLA